MIGMVLVTHCRLAEEFKAAVEHVLGAQSNFACVCIAASDDMEDKRKEIVAKIAEVKTESGVVIFTDMFGGTPSNLSISVMEEGQVEVVAGMNLPMLIKFASIRGKTPIIEACMEAQESGRKYINVASNLLARPAPHDKANKTG